MSDTYKLRGCYAECMGGWHKILDWLDTQLSKNCAVLQVKEKFGTLRVYVSTNDEQDFEAADEAERRSMDTCELCGASPAETYRDRGWVITRCAECRDANKE